MTRLIRLLGPWMAAALWLAAAQVARAGGAEYVLPTNGDNVIGSVTTAVAEHEDTLLDIGRRYGVGYEEIIAANPGVDPWLPGAGTEVLIPTRFVLPDAPREGIVVNLPEHRLYYYPPAKPGEKRVVRTYPISTGKMDWKTPLGVTRVASKQVRPNWYPPKTVRLEHEEKGDPLPPFIPPGPDNPLGEYAMRLGIPGGSYLIHGTNRPAGVGMQVTHGCISHVPGGHRGVLRDDPREHQGESRRPDDEGRLVARHAVRRAPGAARGDERPVAHGSCGTHEARQRCDRGAADRGRLGRGAPRLRSSDQRAGAGRP